MQDHLSKRPPLPEPTLTRHKPSPRGTCALLVGLLMGGAAHWSQARALGADGHWLVAEMAEQRLGPKARAEVARLLAPEPGATLPSISKGPDENRSLGTAAWHYDNFRNVDPGDFQMPRLCVEGNCLVWARAAVREPTVVRTKHSPAGGLELGCAMSRVVPRVAGHSLDTKAQPRQVASYLGSAMPHDICRCPENVLLGCERHRCRFRQPSHL